MSITAATVPAVEAPRGGSHAPPVLAARVGERVFNTRLVIPMLRFFEDRHGRPALESLVDALEVPMASLEDPDQWVSSELVRQLTASMVELTQDRLLPYQAGLALLTKKYFGPTYHLVRALGSPRIAYSRMEEFNRHLSKITRWEVAALSDRRAVLRFHVAPGHSDDPLFCLNRQGGLAGVPTVFDLPQARVDHSVCIHTGAPYCEYRLQWMPPGVVGKVTASVVLGSALLMAPLVGFGVLPQSSLALLALVVLASGVVTIFTQSRRIRQILDVTQAQIADMKQVIEDNQRGQQERALVEKVDRLTRRELDLDTLIETALKELTSTLGYDRALLMQVDRTPGHEPFLGHARAVGFAPERRNAVSALTVSLAPRTDDPRLFANLVASGEGLLVQDVNAFREQLSPDNQALVDSLGTRAFVAVPVHATAEAGGGPLGLLIVDQLDPDRHLTLRDMELMEQVAHLLGMALANARLVRDLKQERRDLQNSLLVQQKFAQYLPRPVVDGIRQDPEAALRLGGHRLPAAILFSDIVGFTPWSERQDPEAVVSFLNRYFARMDLAVETTSGIVDKRIGDGLMVVFVEETDEARAAGAARGNPARRALTCGILMQRAIRELREDPIGRRFEGLRIRIGVSFGDLVAGNLGSSLRLEYTVIGDVVNVASRLEHACTPGSVFATQAAVERAGPGFVVKPRGGLEVKGRTQPVSTFEILELEGAVDAATPPPPPSPPPGAP